jgi:GPN-loop GTPase
MKQFLDELGRTCDVINLDFANDHVPYETSIDVRDLVELDKVMDELDLGPNGGLVYCMVSPLSSLSLSLSLSFSSCTPLLSFPR